MELNLHPDGLVFIRDGDRVVYQGTLAEFQQDCSQPLPSLPEGMVMLRYDDETQIMTFYDKKQNAFPVEGKFNCLFSKAVLSHTSLIVSAKVARQERPQPPEGAATIPAFNT